MFEEPRVSFRIEIEKTNLPLHGSNESPLCRSTVKNWIRETRISAGTNTAETVVNRCKHYNGTRGTMASFAETESEVPDPTEFDPDGCEIDAAPELPSAFSAVLAQHGVTNTLVLTRERAAAVGHERPHSRLVPVHSNAEGTATVPVHDACAAECTGFPCKCQPAWRTPVPTTERLPPTESAIDRCHVPVALSGERTRFLLLFRPDTRGNAVKGTAILSTNNARCRFPAITDSQAGRRPISR